MFSGGIFFATPNGTISFSHSNYATNRLISKGFLASLATLVPALNRYTIPLIRPVTKPILR
jgi:hypothetical protein